MINFSKKIVGYSDQISLKPSEKITFMVSCEPQIKIIYSKIEKCIQRSIYIKNIRINAKKYVESKSYILDKTVKTIQKYLV